MKPTLFVLENSIQNYAWGSRSSIATLLGRETPSARPEAELWMGAHPKAPSRIVDPPGWSTLAAAIRESPGAMLGPAVAERFGGELPFLFKVLAAAEPLSIQAHPSLSQAREGFARENRAGVPMDAPHRNYRDANHKPELVAPLTPFVALDGFRPPEEIVAGFSPIATPAIEEALERLRVEGGPSAIRAFLETLLSLDTRAREALLDRARPAATKRKEEAAWTWVTKLDARYPGDMGALAPLYLNLVVLSPGEALYLPAGVLHAYLEGTALEIMANSDNVLRGGLTPKHVDAAELLATLSFRSGHPEILLPEPSGPAQSTYKTPAPEFELSVLETKGATPVQIPGGSLVLNLEGEVTIDAPDRSVRLTKGRTLFVPACVGSVEVVGRARLARAAVPA
jgi:mannose-6-phosphate isomerase